MHKETSIMSANVFSIWHELNPIPSSQKPVQLVSQTLLGLRHEDDHAIPDLAINFGQINH